MKLTELLKGVEVISKVKNTKVSDITDDTRKVKKGSVFVCIKGANFDGHSVAADMLKKGAVAVICEYSLGLKKRLLLETQEAHMRLCVQTSFQILPKNLNLSA